MFVGLQGPQGCGEFSHPPKYDIAEILGKTTLCDGFVAYLSEKMSIKAAVLSLDGTSRSVPESDVQICITPTRIWKLLLLNIQTIIYYLAEDHLEHMIPN